MRERVLADRTRKLDCKHQKLGTSASAFSRHSLDVLNKAVTRWAVVPPKDRRAQMALVTLSLEQDPVCVGRELEVIPPPFDSP